MSLQLKLEGNIRTAKEFGKKVYLGYCDNILIVSYVCDTKEQAYEKLKFNFPQSYECVELMYLGNKETFNSPKVYSIVKELFAYRAGKQCLYNVK